MNKLNDLLEQFKDLSNKIQLDSAKVAEKQTMIRARKARKNLQTLKDMIPELREQLLNAYKDKYQRLRNSEKDYSNYSRKSLDEYYQQQGDK